MGKVFLSFIKPKLLVKIPYRTRRRHRRHPHHPLDGAAVSYYNSVALNEKSVRLSRLTASSRPKLSLRVRQRFNIPAFVCNLMVIFTVIIVYTRQTRIDRTPKRRRRRDFFPFKVPVFNFVIFHRDISVGFLCWFPNNNRNGYHRYHRSIIGLNIGPPMIFRLISYNTMHYRRFFYDVRISDKTNKNVNLDTTPAVDLSYRRIIRISNLLCKSFRRHWPPGSSTLVRYPSVDRIVSVRLPL